MPFSRVFSFLESGFFVFQLLFSFFRSYFHNSQKTSFFANISNHNAKTQLKKLLNIKDLKLDEEFFDVIKSEIEFAKLDTNLQKTTEKIQKTGNIHLMTEQIRQMKKKQKTLASNILKNKRRQALKGLLRDQVKKQRLKVHARSLVERKQRLQKIQ